MPVAHGGVGQQEAVLRLHPIGQTLRTPRSQNILSPLSAVTEGNWRFRRLNIAGRAGLILGFRMSVDRNICNIGQDLRGSIAPLAEFEQVSCRVDKAGGIFVIQEGGMLKQIFHEGDIGAYTANPKFAQRSVHPCNCSLRCWCPSGDLF